MSDKAISSVNEPVTNKWWASGKRIFQSSVLFVGPLSTLAFVLAPVRYQCWWVGQQLARLTWEWIDWMDDQPWCAEGDVTEFQVFAPLWGLVVVPVLALLLGWAARRVQVHWSVRLMGGLYGVLAFSTLVTYFFWLAGKS